MNAAVAALRRRLMAFAFLDQAGPIYAIYPLLFVEGGLTLGAISTVYALWSVAAALLEVPTGALADLVDRRRLIAGALVFRVAGIAVWLLWPGWWGSALGAVLWATQTALHSGAWEALIYDELDAHGAADAFTGVYARATQAGYAGTIVGMMSSAALLAAGVPLVVLGWLTVLLHGPSAAVILSLPRAPRAAVDDGLEGTHNDRDEEDASPTSLRAWARTVTGGWRTVTTRPGVAPVVVLGAALASLFILDEYIHLTARARGADEAVIPLFVAVLWGGLIVGGELAARWPRMSPLALGVALSSLCGVTALGLLEGALWGVGLMAAAYAGLQCACIVVEARTQPLVPTAHRATVGSFRSALDHGLSGLSFLFVGALASPDDPTVGLIGVLGLLMLAGLAVVRWVPPAGSASMVAETSD